MRSTYWFSHQGTLERTAYLLTLTTAYAAGSVAPTGKLF